MKSYADDLPNEDQKPKKRDSLFTILLCLNLVVGVVNVILSLN